MSRGKANNLVGQRFSRLVVVERAANLAGNPNSRWLCRCDCGGTCIVFAPNLRNGNTKGCGCLQHPPEERIIAGDAPTKHPLYSRWQEMIDRCTKPNRASFRHYGGRGITVCDRWLNGDGNRFGFICFVEDMGGCPDGFTLDRINNNGNYEPGNCRWASDDEQGQNRRTTKLSAEAVRAIRTSAGVPLAELASSYGVSAATIHAVLTNRSWKNQPAMGETK